jgi:Flp pilus assembly protein CpaB
MTAVIIILAIIAVGLLGCAVWLIESIIHAPEGREIPYVGFVREKKVLK